MKPPRMLPLLCAVAVGAWGAPSAFAAWAWSPDTGWVGPGGAVKDTPQQQLTFALELFEQREYAGARREFAKLLKAYEFSREAVEAQYYLGRCREEEGEFYHAFLEYRRTIQVYPSTKRFDEILERSFRIGNHFLSGKKRKLLGTAAILPARDKAVEIFRAIVEDGPFSAYGVRAQYQLGMAHLALGDYEQAVEAFDQLLSRYPTSSLVDDARFQMAQASLKGVFDPEHDQSPTDSAMRELEGFLREHPDSELAQEAGSRLEELTRQRAAHDYAVAQFYEQRKQPESARLYYQVIVDEYADTPAAEQAARRLAVLQGPGPK